MSLHLVCLIDKNNKRHLQLEVVSQKQGGVGMVSLREENIVFYLVSSLIFGRFPFHIFSFSPPAWFQLFLSLFCWSGYSLYFYFSVSYLPFVIGILFLAVISYVFLSSVVPSMLLGLILQNVNQIFRLLSCLSFSFLYGDFPFVN